MRRNSALFAIGTQKNIGRYVGGIQSSMKADAEIGNIICPDALQNVRKTWDVVINEPTMSPNAAANHSVVVQPKNAVRIAAGGLITPKKTRTSVVTINEMVRAAASTRILAKKKSDMFTLR